MKGRVLLLDNFHTLEGEITKVEDQYHLRRPVGEMWIPARKVLSLCGSLQEAFDYMASRANLRDPDERLRLARWSQLRGLREQAIEQARAAVEMRPQHLESKRLLQSLQRTGTETATTPQSPREEGTSAPAPAPLVECNPESLVLFTNRVQPILMNACATCHANGRGGAYKLVRAFEQGSVLRRATQQNLATTMAYVHRDRPLSSPLLVRAVTAHGEADRPPLKNRQIPAYRTLEDWIRLAVENTQGRDLPVWPAQRPAETREPVEPMAPAGSGSNRPMAAAAPRIADPVPMRPSAPSPASGPAQPAHSSSEDLRPSGGATTPSAGPLPPSVPPGAESRLHSREPPVLAAFGESMAESRSKPGSEGNPQGPALVASAITHPAPSPTLAKEPRSPTPPPMVPAIPRQPVDAFDPLPFNAQMHPERLGLSGPAGSLAPSPPGEDNRSSVTVSRWTANPGALPPSATPPVPAAAPWPAGPMNPLPPAEAPSLPRLFPPRR